MQITVETLKKVVNLNQGIINNSNLRKDGPLSNLIFIINDGVLYTLAQGSKNISHIALLIKVADTDEPEGVYAIDGGRMSRVLAECEEEVDLEFINDDTQQIIQLHTEFGVIKFTSYRIEESSPETRFSQILPSYIALKDDVEEDGHQIPKDQWENDLQIVGVTREEEFVHSPFTISQELVGIFLTQMVLRYKSEYPYHFATELDIIRVLKDIVQYGGDNTYSKITEAGARNQFLFSNGSCFLFVNGVNTQPNRQLNLKWDQEVEYTGAVDVAELQRLLRVSNIFIEGNAPVELDFDFENQQMKVKTEGVGLDNQSGVNTHLAFTHNNDNETDYKAAVDGTNLLKLLNFTDDELVNIELIPERKQMHVTFSEGDFYVYYRALS